MTVIPIEIPRLNDSPSDYENLFHIWFRTLATSEDIEFKFSRCDFLRPNAVAFLGGLCRLLQLNNRTVYINWESFNNNAVFMNLCQNGFAGRFGYDSSGWDGNSIPYREDIKENANEIMDYLTDN